MGHAALAVLRSASTFVFGQVELLLGGAGIAIGSSKVRLFSRVNRHLRDHVLGIKDLVAIVRGLYSTHTVALSAWSTASCEAAIFKLAPATVLIVGCLSRSPRGNRLFPGGHCFANVGRGLDALKLQIRLRCLHRLVGDVVCPPVPLHQHRKVWDRPSE